MIRRSVLIGVGTGLLTTGAVAALIAKPGEATLALRKYAAAACVPPHDEQGTLTWNNDINLPNGLKINVSASAFVGGLVFVRYPDSSVRHVTMAHDYVYPHDIRLAGDAKTLWLVNSGLGGGIWPEAHLYEYDISSRILVRDLDVDPDDLPEPCPITTARAAPQPPTTR